jgi:hypothetical protein
MFSVVSKLRAWRAEDGRYGRMLWLWCPGCAEAHAVEVGPAQLAAGAPLWQWNGDEAKPTISPSILVYGLPCHSYVRDGMIQFLGDSGHALAGQTVPLPPLPDWLAT